MDLAGLHSRGCAHCLCRLRRRPSESLDTWAKAATNILAAVQAAVVTPTGATHVVVSNGTYRVLTAANSIYIGRGITVEGLGGAGKTIVAGVAGAQVYPNFDLDHPDAVVEGFASQTANFGAIVNQGTLRHCILRNNTGNTTYGSDSGFGAGLVCLKGAVTNTIVWGNTITTNSLPEVANNVSPASVGFLSYSCAPELTPGVRGNSSANPRFVDFTRRNFRLQDQSPCINKGANQDWMASALDLDSLRRVNAQCVDMGAYEFIFPPGTHFLVR